MTISRNLSILADGVSASGVLDVASGGTGVTVSSGASSVMLRDTNQNVAINRLNQANTNTAAAAGITTLTAASAYSQTLTGTGAQTYRMPDATTLSTGVAFIFNNNATGTLTLQDSASGAIGTITAGGAVELICVSTATVAGTWDYHGFLPENVTWGTNALAMGSTVVTGGTWQGGTIASAYGGTGLTTFTAANNALYSTSASALVAGTLPAAAGGTGQSSYAVGDLLYASTTTALSKLADVATGNALISGGVGVAPSYGKIGLTTHVSGTLPVANGGTGATTLTLNGVVYGNGTSAAGITAAGTTGQVLIATTSGAPSWGSVPTTAAVTSITFGSTGLTPATATTGAVTVAGTLAVANGGTGVTTSTGSGSNVLSTSPTLVSPALGTPTALVGTNITGTASGLSIGGNAATATTATNQSGGTVAATTGSFSGLITSSVGGTGLSFTGATSNLILWNTNGVAAPTFTTRSAGTKLVLYPALSASGADYGFGIEGGTLWSGVPSTTEVFKWYGGTTLAATLTGAGNLTTVGTVTATNHIGPGTGLTGTASSLSIGGNAATATTATTATTANALNTANAYQGTTFTATTQFSGPGTGLTGTASSLSIGGNAATASNASLLNSISAVNLYNNMGNPHSTYTSFDSQGTSLSQGFGYRFIQGSTNSPGTNGAAQYYSWNIGLGSEYASNTYAAQFALPRDVTTPYLSVRYEEGSVFKAWQKIAAGYADTAGNGGVTSIVAGTNVTISGATGAVTINATAGTATAVTLPSTNPFVQNATTLSANLTITGNNAMAAGPITINTSVTLTIATGSRVVIV